jgi:hypothetical protein
MQTYEEFLHAAQAVGDVLNEAFWSKKDSERWFSALRINSMLADGRSVAECADRMQVSRQAIYDALRAARMVDLGGIKTHLSEPHGIAAVQMVTETPKPVFRIAEDLGWEESKAKRVIREALERGYLRVADELELAPGAKEILFQTTCKPYVHPDPRNPADTAERMVRTMNIVRRAEPERFHAVRVRLTESAFRRAVERVLPSAKGDRPVAPPFTEHLVRRDSETRERRAKRGVTAGVNEKRTDGIAVGLGPCPDGQAAPEEVMWRFLEEFKDGEAAVYPAYVGLDRTARRALLEEDLPRIHREFQKVLAEEAKKPSEGPTREYMLVFAWADVRTGRTARGKKR